MTENTRDRGRAKNRAKRIFHSLPTWTTLDILANRYKRIGYDYSRDYPAPIRVIDPNKEEK